MPVEQTHVAAVADEYGQVLCALGEPRVVETVDAHVSLERREAARATSEARPLASVDVCVDRGGQALGPFKVAAILARSVMTENSSA